MEFVNPTSMGYPDVKMPAPHTPFTKITVTFEKRADGGLRAYSRDVPGFVLSHWDVEALILDVQPALETILSAMWGIAVAASPLSSLRPVEDDDGAPEVPEAHLCPKEYVAYAA